MKKSYFFFTSLVFTTLPVIGCGTSGSKNIDQKAPTYTGMSVVNQDEQINVNEQINRDSLLQPFNKLNDLNDTVDVEDQDYVLHKNEKFLFEIHFDNPYEYEIQSFTINNVKYANYMFEKGSTLEVLYLKSTAPDTHGKFSYTIDAIKYIDDEKIKNVRIGGEQTIGVEVVPYHVTFDSNGGKAAYDPIEIDPQEFLELPYPERDGYSFNRWITEDGSIQRVQSGQFNYYKDLNLVAIWDPIEYQITYNLNGGVNSSNNPNGYNLEEQVTLSAPSKTGYDFVGWFDEKNNQITRLGDSLMGDLVLTARWSAKKNTLSVTSQDPSKGIVSIASGSGYSDETIVVEAIPTGDYVFYGWYQGSRLMSKETHYSFKMPTSDYAISARFLTQTEKTEIEAWNSAHYAVPTIDTEAMTVTYGLCPQTRVKDDSVLTELNALTKQETNGWYLYNNEYYAKTTGIKYSGFEDNTTIENGKTYWFKCEPITWEILSNNNGEYLLLSSILVDAHRFNERYYEKGPDGLINCYNSQGISHYNYEYSEIRSWLNNEFYDSAFALDSSFVLTTIIDNSSNVMLYNSNSVNPVKTDNTRLCNNTEDKVFLLNDQDYQDYGFTKNSQRRCRATDWVAARGGSVNIYPTSNHEQIYAGDYWTRCTTTIQYIGAMSAGQGVDFTHNCVRPAITLKIN